MSTPLYRPIELMQDEKITKFEFDDFIGVWDRFVPKPLCDQIVKYFDDVMDNRGCYIRTDYDDNDQDSVYRSEDYYNGALNRKDFAFLMNYANDTLTTQINSCLKSCALHYIEQYQQLKQSNLISTDLKIQKTPPGGGYHIWHYENSSMWYAMRDLTWMIYLNDMPEGEAETEFLYQKRRIRPTAGTVVIWPAGFTHVHKGNTVFSQDKYILTGWYIKSK